VLVGSPQQIVDKILYFREAFGHDLQSFSLPTMLPHEQQLEMLERVATEVIPVVRREAPTTLWTDLDPYGGRPAFAGRQSPDAAAVIDSAAQERLAVSSGERGPGRRIGTRFHGLEGDVELPERSGELPRAADFDL
jgi:hypothetical protein